MPTSPDIGQKWIHRNGLSRGKRIVVTVIDVSSYRSGKEGEITFSFRGGVINDSSLPISKFLTFYQPYTGEERVGPRTQWDHLQAED